MDTDFRLQGLLLVLRGLEHYKKYLYEEVERLTDLAEETDKDFEVEIANLVDEAHETANVIRFADEVYAYKHEQEYGEPPAPVRKS